MRADIVNGLWTPDQAWTYPAGATFASLGLNPGVYEVSDATTGETITINIGGGPVEPSVPVPTTGFQALMLMAALMLLLGGLSLRRRNRL